MNDNIKLLKNMEKYCDVIDESLTQNKRFIKNSKDKETYDNITDYVSKIKILRHDIEQLLIDDQSYNNIAIGLKVSRVLSLIDLLYDETEKLSYSFKHKSKLQNIKNKFKLQNIKNKFKLH